MSQNEQKESLPLLRLLRNPAEDHDSAALMIYYLYNNGMNGRIRHACIVVEYSLPNSSSITALTKKKYCYLRYDLTMMSLEGAKPFIVVSERWASAFETSKEMVCKDRDPLQPRAEEQCNTYRGRSSIVRGLQPLESYSEYRMARPTSAFSRQQVKQLIVARWSHRMEYVDEGPQTDESGGSEANNNCVTFAKTLWNMLVHCEEQLPNHGSRPA